MSIAQPPPSATLLDSPCVASLARKKLATFAAEEQPIYLRRKYFLHIYHINQYTYKPWHQCKLRRMRPFARPQAALRGRWQLSTRSL